MKAYIYRAALLCESCAVDVKAGLLGVACVDEDSDRWPQGPYLDGGGESDSPQHCDHCSVFLENPLTLDGVAYVRDSILDAVRAGDRTDSVALTVWRGYYADSLDASGELSPYPSPGKFEGEVRVAEVFYAWMLDGGEDDTAGDCQECGQIANLFRGPFKAKELERGAADCDLDGGLTFAESFYLECQCAGAILWENDQGFVSLSLYESAAELESDWEKIVADLSPPDNDDDAGEDDSAKIGAPI